MPSPVSWVERVRLSTQQVRHPEWIRSPNRILAHLWGRRSMRKETPSQLTNRGIMVVFIYGGMAHANLEKWETFERWKSNPLAFPFMQCRFDETIMAGLGAIAYVCGLSERELAAQEGIPSGGTGRKEESAK